MKNIYVQAQSPPQVVRSDLLDISNSDRFLTQRFNSNLATGDVCLKFENVCMIIFRYELKQNGEIGLIQLLTSFRKYCIAETINMFYMCDGSSKFRCNQVAHGSLLTISSDTQWQH